MRINLIFLVLSISSISFAQSNSNPEIPSVLSGIYYDQQGQLMIEKNNQRLKDTEKTDLYGLQQMLGKPVGGETGIYLDFKNPWLNGIVAYGPYSENSEFPTIAFLPRSVKILEGKALIELKSVFKGPNDFFKLEEKAKGIIGYRVIDSNGRNIYEGRVAFTGSGPYKVVPTIVEGPFVNKVGSTSCVVSFETHVPIKAILQIGERKIVEETAATHHEIEVNGLLAQTNYTYSISYGDRQDNFQFRTAAKEGSRRPFTFAFAAAHRATTGGGERDFGGTNYQASRSIMASAVQNQAVFMLAMGDMTNGGNATEDGHLLEYANWKRSMEPFWHSTPVYAGFGDHEVNYTIFSADSITKRTTKMDRFPYRTESGEATFAKAFVHPTNGPQSEDGSIYDPSPTQENFPTYQENVYHFTYDNVAMIVLNTEYWKCHDPKMSGMPEGYLMDKQFEWLKETMDKYEKDINIDHIIVNVHSAVFPNGDHANGAMWYNGKNTERARVAGVPVKVGILERRDQLLDLCVNKSKKFVAFISGDEHNFAFLEVTPDMNIYPDNYELPKIKLSRKVYHINNGGGGSASYAMLPTPWMKQFRFFTEPPVLALIHVDGNNVSLTAFNAETFGKICKDIKLR